MSDVFRRSNKVNYDFIHLVPKEKRENLEFRRKILLKCAKSVEFRKSMWAACKRDTLFFYNTFLWVYEPRPGMPCGHGKIPFITWPGQDRAIEVLDRFWGLEDIRFWKTRGEGATWLACMRIFKDWVFDDKWDPGAFGMVSRNEETVDSPDDPDSLMWKLDWQLKQMPSWMVPSKGQYSRKISEHSLKNHLNDATVIGYAASEDVGSGGRKRVFFMDELAKFGLNRKGADYASMASTFPVTECRVVVSTPKGTANAYHDAIVEDVDVDDYKVTSRPLTDDDHRSLNDKGVVILHWSDNPIRNRSMFYVSKTGDLRDVDEGKYGSISEDYRHAWPDIRAKLERKGFRVLGTMRSPWYDRQCLRPNATPQNIAQELDLDFGGSGYTIFDNDTMAAARQHVKIEKARYQVDYNQYSLDGELLAHSNGMLKLWVHLMPNGSPPPGRYVIGADIASGLGGSTHSNSVASILDRDTGEQVGEWANNATRPDDFCDTCIALAKMFYDAEIIHEANGPFGKAFSAQLIRRNYWNIYRRRDNYKISQKTTKDLGWGSQKEAKADMFSGLARKIRTGIVKVRSKECVAEMPSWVMDSGLIVHAKAKVTEDESSRNEAHGDRVIALGVAALLFEPDMNKKPEPVTRDEYFLDHPNPNTMAWRLKEYDERIREKEAIDW